LNYLKQSWRSWLRWLAVVAAFSVACAFLSNWQFHRNEEKLARIHLILSNSVKAPIDIAGLGAWNPKLEWSPVTATGHFEPQQALLVRNRPNQGQGGFEQLVPFVTNTGRTVLISRGWLPNGDTAELPADNPLPTDSTRVITFALVASEQPDGRTAPIGQIINIDVPRALKQLNISNGYQQFYGRLLIDSVAKDSLVPSEAPSTDPGNNLSYAIQWIAFAVMACGALVWMFRVERDRYLGIERKPRRKRKTATDEEIEDSLA
jgi:cytochrome oxidase assembly protein ShyY1